MVKYMLALMLFFAGSLSAESDHLKMIPSDMNIVIGLNAKQLLAVPLIKQQLAAAGEPEDLKKAGLSLEDFENVTIALKLGSEKDLMNMKNPPGVAVIGLNKSPDLEKMIAAAKADGAKISAEQLGRKINIIDDNGMKIGVIAEGNNIIIGPLDNVRSTVRVLNGTADSLSENAMMKKLLNTKNMLYAGGAMKDSQEYKGFSLVANYKDALTLFARLYCKNETIAKGLADQAKMGLEPVKKQMQLTDKHVTIGAKGTSLSISLNLPQETLMKAAGMIMMMGAMSGSSEPGPGPDIEEPPAEETPAPESK